ncbi:MAG: dihydroneopterin aldolase [Acidimicrobiales bacterium]
MSGDTIEIRGLRLNGVHGLLAEERQRAQPFEIDIDLTFDMARAGATDALDDTADYSAVVAGAAAVVAGRPHQLLESLAAAVAEVALAHCPAPASVTVVVRKLRPPVPFDVASTGVRMTRARS